MSVTKDNKYRSFEEIDWESARWDYENTKCSFTKLAKKYGTYPMMVQRVAKNEGWEKFDPKAKEVKAAVAKFNDKQSAVERPTAILDTIAVRKVEEIVRELGAHYSTADEPMLIAYAASYQRYLRLEKEVNEEGEVLISPKTGGEYLNPKFNAMQSLKNDIKNFGKELGLTIASRQRLSLKLGTIEDTKSLFDVVEELSSSEDIDV